MKRFLKIAGLLIMALLVFAMCGEKTFQPGDHGGGGKVPPVKPKPKPQTEYEWEKNRKELLKNTDMVLIYGGGHHRSTFEWNEDRLRPYVVYQDESDNLHWMFDAFLMIEFRDKDYQYCSGFGLKSADKKDWIALVDYYFSRKNQLGALDKLIDENIATIGDPAYKHQIVVTLPEPIVYQDANNKNSSTTYWGSIIDGKTLDFSRDVDRIAACKWYIDYVRKKFNEAAFKHLDLAGFYWVAETAQDSRTILKQIGSYLNSMHYSFNWIPYYNSDGHSAWDILGFNYAYYQPNHFFTASIPDSRLEEACKEAKQYKMNMEMEFDGRVLSYYSDNIVSPQHPRGVFTERLYSYMNSFTRNGIHLKPLAYYEGGGALYNMAHATDVRDRRLYHDFCKFVTERPCRQIEQ